MGTLLSEGGGVPEDVGNPLRDAEGEGIEGNEDAVAPTERVGAGDSEDAAEGVGGAENVGKGEEEGNKDCVAPPAGEGVPAPGETLAPCDGEGVRVGCGEADCDASAVGEPVVEELRVGAADAETDPEA